MSSRYPLNALTTTFLAISLAFAACQAAPIDVLGQNTSQVTTCKPRSEIPPPAIDAPNGGACPAVGSDCSGQVVPALCNDGDRRMVLTCDTSSNTWKVLLAECPADGGTSDGGDAAPGADGGAPASNTPPALCKARDEIPPPPPSPMAGVGADGVCPAEGTPCTDPVALCLDRQGRRMYMQCDLTKHTWYIVFKECP